MEHCSKRQEEMRISEQDKAIFSQLVQEVFGMCYSVLACVHDAEDATQEVLLKGFHKGRTLNPEQFRPWILRVAKNHCIDWLRRRKSHPPLSKVGPVHTTSEYSGRTGTSHPSLTRGTPCAPVDVLF